MCDVHPIRCHDAAVVNSKVQGISSVSNGEQIQVIVVVNVDKYGRAPSRCGEQIFESATLVSGAYRFRGIESMQVT